MLKKTVAPGVGFLVALMMMMGMQRPVLLAEEADQGSEIRFETVLLNSKQKEPDEGTREVHPGFQNVSSWISAVGASVAAGDFDNNGFDDEVCLVDPRDDTVWLLPIPLSTSSFEAVLLEPIEKAPAPFAPTGCVTADINRDGFIDAIVYYWGRSPVLFLNNGDNTFAAEEVMNPVQLWNSTTLNVADIDGDGLLDILVGNFFPDGARVLDSKAYDDGRMSMQASLSGATNGGQNRLLLQQDNPRGPISFFDRSDAIPASVSRGWTLAFGLQDLTGNLRPDIYVANDFGPDGLLVNESNNGELDIRQVVQERSLTRPKSSNLGHDTFKGMGVGFIHLDDSPGPSIFVSNITQDYGLHESNFLFVPSGDLSALTEGQVSFEQRSEQYGVSRGGWGWDVKVADFNNDGLDEIVQANGFVAGDVNRWPELQEVAMANEALVGYGRTWLDVQPGTDLSGDNPNRLWCYQPTHRKFRDCAPPAGIDHEVPTRAFAVTDIDGDGRPDLVEANQWGASRVHFNTTDVKGALTIRPFVEGPDGIMTPAVGVRVAVTTDEGVLNRQLYPANGHTGVSGIDLMFGISAQAADVEISWTTSEGKPITRELEGLRVGRHTLILSDDGEVEVL